MATSDFLKLLGLIIDKISEGNDIDIELNDTFLKYLESYGYADDDIEKAVKVVKRLMNLGREEKETYFFSDEPAEGIRLYSPEEALLYNQGSLKRLLFLKEAYLIEEEIIEEIIDILLGLSADDDTFNEDFVDSLLHSILLDYGDFHRITGITAHKKGFNLLQ